MMVVEGEIVCVTGAAGYVGSWLVMRLLERGYVVRASVMDPNNMKEVKHLLELPQAKTKLSLWKGDLKEEGSFDEAINGCAGVFHLATPMDFDSKDPEKEMIKPTVKGMLDIMKSCLKGNVRKLVITSSAGAVNVTDQQKPVYDESCWSDIEFCRRVKMTGWMYFVSKTLAEQAAWKFAEENKMDLISILPTMVVGPFILPTFPPSFLTALSLITRNEAHYTILKQCQFVHLDDLCMSQIFLYEKPGTKGRYICSSHDATIYDLGNMLRSKYPEYNIPTKFRDFDEKIEKVSLSSKKLVEEGFEFKYSLEDMFDGAVKTCREKGLLPKSLHQEDKNHLNES